MYIVCGNLSCQGAARGYLFIMISGKQKGLMLRLMQTESNTTLTSIMAEIHYNLLVNGRCLKAVTRN